MSKEAQPGNRYKSYLLVVLLFIQAFNYADGFVLGLALPNIKADFSLNDTQLGLLSGFAFALFYAIMGIPIARWADRGNRITIITLATFCWSVAVVLCGFVGSFVQLLLVRVGVAVGESGCVPPAHSLIADYFTRLERPRAVARYMLGGSLSIAIGYFLGGWSIQLYGWRLTFMLMGLPGVALAAVAYFSLKEPRRGVSKQSSAPHPGVPSNNKQRAVQNSSSDYPRMSEVWVTLWRNAAFRHLLVGYAILYFFGYGLTNWQPSFFLRSYGLKTGELGTWFTAIYGLGSFIGTYFGGEWASRYAAGNERLQLFMMAIAQCVFAAVTTLVFLSPNKYCAFALMLVATVGANMSQGPFLATIQSLVPARMRAIALAVVYMFANLIGMGLGPLVVGGLSDALRPAMGAESLRYALLGLSPGVSLGCVAYMEGK